MSITADQMNRLTTQLAKSIADVEALRQSDKELKENLCGYYDTICRWIDIARQKQDPAALDLCLLNIKESLAGTVKEWRGQ